MMSLRFLSPKVDSLGELEISRCISNIKQIASKAREVTALDLVDEVDNTFAVLENLSPNTSLKEYQNAATKLLTDDFQYGSEVFIPKLESDIRSFLVCPSIFTGIAIGSARYFVTQNMLMSLLTCGIAIPLVFCIGYCVSSNPLIKLAYMRQYYTDETWKPVTDLKKQLEYFNEHFAIPDNSHKDKLTLGDLVYLQNAEYRKTPYI